MEIAKEGVKELVEEVDSLITIPNQKLLEVLGQDCSMIEAFSQANDVLSGAATNTITLTGGTGDDIFDLV